MPETDGSTGFLMMTKVEFDVDPCGNGLLDTGEDCDDGWNDGIHGC